MSKDGEIPTNACLEGDRAGLGDDFDVTDEEYGGISLNLILNNWFESSVVYLERKG